MGRAKEIILKVIPAKIANEFIRKTHYSGKVVNNSNLHFGAFLDGSLHGAMSFGPSMDKSKVIGLVENTRWNDFLELNRMAFDDYLPRNSESFCIGSALRLIRKNAPHIRWIISFADGAQCGDGTIYRASNFLLTGIRKNVSILEMPSGHHVAAMTLEANWDAESVKKECLFLGVPHKYRTRSEWVKLGAKFIEGYQLRYIYLLDKKAKLTVPVIPNSKIDEYGAGMYLGEKITQLARHISR